MPGEPSEFHWGAPGPPPPDPPGHRRARARTRRRSRVVVVGLVCAVAVVLGAVALLRQGGDAGGARAEGRVAAAGQERGVALRPSSARGHELFRREVPAGTPVGASFRTVRVWATSEVLVRTTKYAVEGLDPVTGTRRWTVPLSGRVCGASETMTSGGKVAVVFEPAKLEITHAPCSELAVIDISAGRKLWQKTIDGMDSSGDGHLVVAVTEEAVAVDWYREGWAPGARTYSLDGRRKLWAARPAGENRCSERLVRGGEGLYTLERCWSETLEYSYTVRLRDPVTGRTEWSFRSPRRDYWTFRLVSVNPTVLAITERADLADGVDESATRLMTVGEDGKLRAEIRLPTPARGCGGLQGTCGTVVAAGGKVYVKTGALAAGELTAYDFRTGKVAWRAEAAGGRRPLWPLRMDDSGEGLIAYEPASDSGSGTGGRVVRLDAEDGSREEWLRLPDASAEEQSQADGVVRGAPPLFAYGRLYFQLQATLGTADPPPALLAFGAEQG
ncbi:PQQ-binding-like beta-propeller repeat protein [Streptomyces sp. NPDC051940]|uniref:outer membrane protein assembly factor BamB family protein n=1 Tax=Streptomyces sp. NPDC051940 TaxID=3155675 RepID=UPI003438BE8E